MAAEISKTDEERLSEAIESDSSEDNNERGLVDEDGMPFEDEGGSVLEGIGGVPDDNRSFDDEPYEDLEQPTTPPRAQPPQETVLKAGDAVHHMTHGSCLCDLATRAISPMMGRLA